MLNNGSRRSMWRKEAKRCEEELKKLKRDKNKAVGPIQESFKTVQQNIK